MKEILESYTTPELKKMIKATNLTGYSKLKKDELIKLMIRPENIERFQSIKPKSARLGPAAETPKPKVLKELKKLFPAYKEYIEFYQKNNFEKPKDLPGPPKWLLEGKEPPASFKIPSKLQITIKKKRLIKKKPKKERSEAQKENDKKLGEMAKAKAEAKK